MPHPHSSPTSPSLDDWMAIAPWPMHLLDSRGHPFGPNPALATVLGFSPDQLDRQQLAESLSDSSRRRLAKTRRRLLNADARQFAELQLQYRRRDGTPVEVRRGRLGPTDRADGPLLVMLQGLKAISTLDRSSIQARLARLIAHEFNNVFTVAKSYVDLARRQQPTARLAANYLQRASRAIRRGIAAAERLQILALDKRLPMEQCAIDEVVEMIRPFLPRLLETGPRWSVFCQSDLPELRSHRTLLSRFFLDFILNAQLRWPHADQLELEIRSSSSDKPAVIIRVVPPDALASALPVEFRPFLSSDEPLIPGNTDPLFISDILEGHPISIDTADDSLTALLPAVT